MNYESIKEIDNNKGGISQNWILYEKNTKTRFIFYIIDTQLIFMPLNENKKKKCKLYARFKSLYDLKDISIECSLLSRSDKIGFHFHQFGVSEWYTTKNGLSIKKYVYKLLKKHIPSCNTLLRKDIAYLCNIFDQYSDKLDEGTWNSLHKRKLCNNFTTCPICCNLMD